MRECISLRSNILREWLPWQHEKCTHNKSNAVKKRQPWERFPAEMGTPGLGYDIGTNCDFQLRDSRRRPEDQGTKPSSLHLHEVYTPGKRLQECACVAICLLLMAVNGVLICGHIRLENLHSVFISALLGMLVADFGSGFVHWFLDTWGSADSFPVVGKHILRRFRMHHLDPTSITRHDFIETNGDNFAVGIPFLSYLAWYQLSHESLHSRGRLAWICFVYLFSILLAMTNQIHKWSHTYFGLPRFVTFLQRCHIILPRLHHRQHHVSPHETYYCITTGWLNWPLEKMQFWSRLEVLIEGLTGCRPRSDDMLWASRKS